VENSRDDWETRVGFTNTREKRTWVIQAFNRNTADMIHPHVQWTLPDGTRRVVSAAGGAWSQDHWLLTNVQEYTYPPLRGAYPIQSNYDSRSMTEFTETPEEILIQIKLGKIQSFRQARRAQLSIREIFLYRKLHPEDVGKNTMLHGRLSTPWTCLVVVLIALPFGAGQARRNAFVGVASSILICFVYFVFQQLSLALGFGGRLPGWLAGWMPNLLFGLAGVLLTLRIR
jgi:lipopolysaccharide export system permease protein